MKANVYIGNDLIGTTNFQISDETMGAVIGDFFPNEHYKKYQTKIQSLTKDKGIANMSDFKFKLEIEEKHIVSPAGGIGIIDSKELDEIVIESAGNGKEIIERIKREIVS